MNSKVQVFVQSKGYQVAVLLEGEEADVYPVFLSFLNWGASLSEELFIIGYNQYYFWCTHRRLLKYYENILEHKFYLKFGHEPEGRARDLIPILAQTKVNNLPYRNFLPQGSRFFLECTSFKEEEI